MVHETGSVMETCVRVGEDAWQSRGWVRRGTSCGTLESHLGTLDEQTREWTLKLLEIEMEAQDKLDRQEQGFRQAFEQEKGKLIEESSIMN